MKKEQIMELIPELSEEQLDAIISLYEKSVSELKKEQSYSGEAAEEAYRRGMADAEKKFEEAEFERLLEDALNKAGAKNNKALRALLDMENISFCGGALEGLSEQLDAIKKESGYMFSDEAQMPRFTSATASSGEKLDLDKLSYKERLKLYRESPELYRSLSR